MTYPQIAYGAAIACPGLPLRCVSVFQYLPFFSAALPLPNIKAQGVGILHFLGATPPQPTPRLPMGQPLLVLDPGWVAMWDDTHAAAHSFSVPPFFSLLLCHHSLQGSRNMGTA